MIELLAKIRHSKFVGFSKVGVVTTLTSMTLLFIFLELLSTPLILTYVCIYTFMIFVSLLLNSTFVFKAKKSKKRAALYYLAYLISLGLGVLLLSIFKVVFNFLPNWILAYMVIPFTMTSNFLMISNIFKPSKK